MKRKILQIIFIITFFLIILIPVAFMNFKQNQISEIDNSKLPELKQVKNASSLDNYISKRIGFRTKFINVYTRINDVIFREMVHPTYTYGKDGYVFFKIRAEKHDDEYLDTFAHLVKNMQQYVQERGSYFLFILNPTKVSVYNQYLPNGYIFTNYRVNYLKNKLNELGVNYIDNTECLVEKSLESQVFNQKYDAGHWNDIGAFYGINNIYKKLRTDNINIPDLEQNDYNIQYEVKNTLPVSEFKINEEIPVYKLSNVNYELTTNYSKEIKLSKKYKTYIESKNETIGNNYNVLFFRGSYMNDKMKFICNKFSKMTLVHNYENSINFDYYYNIVEPNIVMFETVEYAIGGQYYPSEAIKEKVYNQLYAKYKDYRIDEIMHIDFTEILKGINNDYNKGDALTTIYIDKNNYDYAYLELDQKIYDFSYKDNTAEITLPVNLLINKEFELILVSEKEAKQQKIKIGEKQ